MISLFYRIVSVAICVCFISTSCLADVAGIKIDFAVKSEMPRMAQLDIPAELASLEEVWEAPAGANPKMVLHIQNAHTHYDAQTKIRDLMLYLNKNYGFKTVFVEGASGELEPDRLSLFPDMETNRKFWDVLAQRGQITGADWFLLENSSHGPRATDHGPRTTNKTRSTGHDQSSLSGTRAPEHDKQQNEEPGRGPWPEERASSSSVDRGPETVARAGEARGVGIEEPELYHENHEALKAVFLRDAETARFLAGLDAELDKLATRILPPETRQTLLEWKKFEKGHREFIPFVESLAKLAKKNLGLDLRALYSQIEWPQLTRVLVLQETERLLGSDTDLQSVPKPSLSVGDKDATAKETPGVGRNKPPRVDSDTGRITQDNPGGVASSRPRGYSSRTVKELAEIERRQMIDWLKAHAVRKELVERLDRFSEKNISMNRIRASAGKIELLPRLFMEQLLEETGPKGMKLSEYPNFALYAGLMILRYEIEPAALFDEIRRLFGKLLETPGVGQSHSPGVDSGRERPDPRQPRRSDTATPPGFLERSEPREKELIALFRDAELARKLLTLELNVDEWREVSERQRELLPQELFRRVKLLQGKDQDARSRKETPGVGRSKSPPDPHKILTGTQSGPSSQFNRNLKARAEVASGEKQISTTQADPGGATASHPRSQRSSYQREVLTAFENAFAFYDIAIRRDEVFFRKIMETLETGNKEKTPGVGRSRSPGVSSGEKSDKPVLTVLMTGGFHTEALKSFFREEGVSYGILTPRMAGPGSPTLYREVMLGRSGAKIRDSGLAGVTSGVSQNDSPPDSHQILIGDQSSPSDRSNKNLKARAEVASGKKQIPTTQDDPGRLTPPHLRDLSVSYQSSLRPQPPDDSNLEIWSPLAQAVSEKKLAFVNENISFETVKNAILEATGGKNFDMDGIAEHLNNGLFAGESFEVHVDGNQFKIRPRAETRVAPADKTVSSAVPAVSPTEIQPTAPTIVAPARSVTRGSTAWRWTRAAIKLALEYTIYAHFCAFGFLGWNWGVFALIIAADLAEIFFRKTVTEKALDALKTTLELYREAKRTRAEEEASGFKWTYESGEGTDAAFQKTGRSLRGAALPVVIAAERYVAVFAASAAGALGLHLGSAGVLFAGLTGMLWFIAIDAVKRWTKFDPIGDMHKAYDDAQIPPRVETPTTTPATGQPSSAPATEGKARAEARDTEGETKPPASLEARQALPESIRLSGPTSIRMRFYDAVAKTAFGRKEGVLQNAAKSILRSKGVYLYLSEKIRNEIEQIAKDPGESSERRIFAAQIILYTSSFGDQRAADLFVDLLSAKNPEVKQFAFEEYSYEFSARSDLYTKKTTEGILNATMREMADKDSRIPPRALAETLSRAHRMLTVNFKMEPPAKPLYDVILNYLPRVENNPHYYGELLDILVNLDPPQITPWLFETMMRERKKEGSKIYEVAATKLDVALDMLDKMGVTASALLSEEQESELLVLIAGEMKHSRYAGHDDSSDVYLDRHNRFRRLAESLVRNPVARAVINRGSEGGNAVIEQHTRDINDGAELDPTTFAFARRSLLQIPVANVAWQGSSTSSLFTQMIRASLQRRQPDVVAWFINTLKSSNPSEAIELIDRLSIHGQYQPVLHDGIYEELNASEFANLIDHVLDRADQNGNGALQWFLYKFFEHVADREDAGMFVKTYAEAVAKHLTRSGKLDSDYLDKNRNLGIGAFIIMLNNIYKDPQPGLANMLTNLRKRLPVFNQTEFLLTLSILLRDPSGYLSRLETGDAEAVYKELFDNLNGKYEEKNVLGSSFSQVIREDLGIKAFLTIRAIVRDQRRFVDIYGAAAVKWEDLGATPEEVGGWIVQLLGKDDATRAATLEWLKEVHFNFANESVQFRLLEIAKNAPDNSVRLALLKLASKSSVSPEAGLFSERLVRALFGLNPEVSVYADSSAGPAEAMAIAKHLVFLEDGHPGFTGDNWARVGSLLKTKNRGAEDVLGAGLVEKILRSVIPGANEDQLLSPGFVENFKTNFMLMVGVPESGIDFSVVSNSGFKLFQMERQQFTRAHAALRNWVGAEGYQAEVAEHNYDRLWRWFGFHADLQANGMDESDVARHFSALTKEVNRVEYMTALSSLNKKLAKLYLTLAADSKRFQKMKSWQENVTGLAQLNAVYSSAASMKSGDDLMAQVEDVVKRILESGRRAQAKEFSDFFSAWEASRSAIKEEAMSTFLGELSKTGANAFRDQLSLLGMVSSLLRIRNAILVIPGKEALIQEIDAGIDKIIKEKNKKEAASTFKGVLRMFLTKETGAVNISDKAAEALERDSILMDRLLVLLKLSYTQKNVHIQEHLKHFLETGSHSSLRKMVLDRQENKAEIDRLVGLGYPRRLFEDGIEYTQVAYPVNDEGRRKSHEKTIRRISADIIQIAAGLGYPPPVFQNGEEGFKTSKEAKNYIDALATAMPGHNRQGDLNVLLANIELEESKIKASVGRTKPVTIRVVFAKDYIDEVSSCKGVAGCYAPGGIHEEVPPKHALEAHTFIARLYDENGGVAANAVVTLTDKGALVYASYPGTGNDLDLGPLWLSLWKTLAKVSPGVILRPRAAGREEAEKEFGISEHKTATRDALMWGSNIYMDGDWVKPDGTVEYAIEKAIVIPGNSEPVADLPEFRKAERAEAVSASAVEAETPQTEGPVAEAGLTKADKIAIRNDLFSPDAKLSHLNLGPILGRLDKIVSDSAFNIAAFVNAPDNIKPRAKEGTVSDTDRLRLIEKLEAIRASYSTPRAEVRDVPQGLTPTGVMAAGVGLPGISPAAPGIRMEVRDGGGKIDSPVMPATLQPVNAGIVAGQPEVRPGVAGLMAAPLVAAGLAAASAARTVPTRRSFLTGFGAALAAMATAGPALGQDPFGIGDDPFADLGREIGDSNWRPPEGSQRNFSIDPDRIMPVLQAYQQTRHIDRETLISSFAPSNALTPLVDKAIERVKNAHLDPRLRKKGLTSPLFPQGEDGARDWAVLFLEGLDAPHFGLSIGNLNVIIVPGESYKKECSGKTEEEKLDWITRKILHEGIHIWDREMERNGKLYIDGLTTERNAFWGTYWASVLTGVESEAQKKVATAFDALVSQKGKEFITREVFGLPVNDFAALYYNGVVYPVMGAPGVVGISLYDVRDQDETRRRMVLVDTETGDLYADPAKLPVEAPFRAIYEQRRVVAGFFGVDEKDAENEFWRLRVTETIPGIMGENSTGIHLVDTLNGTDKMIAVRDGELFLLERKESPAPSPAQPTTQPRAEARKEGGAVEVSEGEIYGDYVSVFEGSALRPDILKTLRLVQSGALNDEKIIELAKKHAGQSAPDMEAIKVEVKNIMPYLYQAVNQLIQEFKGHTILFAGRDAETMCDVYKLVVSVMGLDAPKAELFPGSRKFWEALKNEPDATSAARRSDFLNSVGINKAALAPEANEKWVVVDSGFNGSIGRFLHKEVRRSFPDLNWKTQIAGKIKVRVLSNHLPRRDGAAEELVPQLRLAKEHGLENYDSPDISQRITQQAIGIFPRAGKVVSEDKYEMGGVNLTSAKEHARFIKFNVATVLQLLPKFHGPYEGLSEDGSVMEGEVRYDERLKENTNTNGDFINPVAATLVQRYLASHVLEAFRSGELQNAVPLKSTRVLPNSQVVGRSSVIFNKLTTPQTAPFSGEIRGQWLHRLVRFLDSLTPADRAIVETKVPVQFRRAEARVGAPAGGSKVRRITPKDSETTRTQTRSLPNRLTDWMDRNYPALIYAAAFVPGLIAAGMMWHVIRQGKIPAVDRGPRDSTPALVAGNRSPTGFFRGDEAGVRQKISPVAPTGDPLTPGWLSPQAILELENDLTELEKALESKDTNENAKALIRKLFSLIRSSGFTLEDAELFRSQLSPELAARFDQVFDNMARRIELQEVNHGLRDFDETFEELITLAGFVGSPHTRFALFATVMSAHRPALDANGTPEPLERNVLDRFAAYYQDHIYALSREDPDAFADDIDFLSGVLGHISGLFIKNGADPKPLLDLAESLAGQLLVPMDGQDELDRTRERKALFELSKALLAGGREKAGMDALESVWDQFANAYPVNPVNYAYQLEDLNSTFRDMDLNRLWEQGSWNTFMSESAQKAYAELMKGGLTTANYEAANILEKILRDAGVTLPVMPVVGSTIPVKNFGGIRPEARALPPQGPRAEVRQVEIREIDDLRGEKYGKTALALDTAFLNALNQMPDGSDITVFGSAALAMLTGQKLLGAYSLGQLVTDLDMVIRAGSREEIENALADYRAAVVPDYALTQLAQIPQYHIGKLYIRIIKKDGSLQFQFDDLNGMTLLEEKERQPFDSEKFRDEIYPKAIAGLRTKKIVFSAEHLMEKATDALRGIRAMVIFGLGTDDATRNKILSALAKATDAEIRSVLWDKLKRLENHGFPVDWDIPRRYGLIIPPEFLRAEARKPLEDELAQKFGVTIEGGQYKFSDKAPNASVAMRVIESDEKLQQKIDAHKMEKEGQTPPAEWARFKPIHYNAARLKHSLDEIRALPSLGGTSASFVGLAIAEIDGEERVGVVKLLENDPLKERLGEIEAAQALDNLGVFPPYYGVVKNEQGEIIGYMMGLVIGEEIKLDDPGQWSGNDAKVVRRVSSQLGSMVSNGIRTGEETIVIDAGMVFRGGPKYQSFVNTYLRPEARVNFNQANKALADEVVRLNSKGGMATPQGEALKGVLEFIGAAGHEGLKEWALESYKAMGGEGQALREANLLLLLIDLLTSSAGIYALLIENGRLGPDARKNIGPYENDEAYKAAVVAALTALSGAFVETAREFDAFGIAHSNDSARRKDLETALKLIARSDDVFDPLIFNMARPEWTDYKLGAIHENIFEGIERLLYGKSPTTSSERFSPAGGVAGVAALTPDGNSGFDGMIAQAELAGELLTQARRAARRARMRAIDVTLRETGEVGQFKWELHEYGKGEVTRAGENKVRVYLNPSLDDFDAMVRVVKRELYKKGMTEIEEGEEWRKNDGALGFKYLYRKEMPRFDQSYADLQVAKIVVYFEDPESAEAFLDALRANTTYRELCGNGLGPELFSKAESWDQVASFGPGTVERRLWGSFQRDADAFFAEVTARATPTQVERVIGFLDAQRRGGKGDPEKIAAMMRKLDELLKQKRAQTKDQAKRPDALPGPGEAVVERPEARAPETSRELPSRAEQRLTLDELGIESPRSPRREVLPRSQVSLGIEGPGELRAALERCELRNAPPAVEAAVAAGNVAANEARPVVDALAAMGEAGKGRVLRALERSVWQGDGASATMEFITPEGLKEIDLKEMEAILEKNPNSRYAFVVLGKSGVPDKVKWDALSGKFRGRFLIGSEGQMERMARELVARIPMAKVQITGAQSVLPADRNRIVSLFPMGNLRWITYGADDARGHHDLRIAKTVFAGQAENAVKAAEWDVHIFKEDPTDPAFWTIIPGELAALAAALSQALEAERSVTTAA